MHPIKLIDLGCGDGRGNGYPLRHWETGGVADAMTEFYPNIPIHVLGVELKRLPNFEIRRLRIKFGSVLADEMSEREDTVDGIIWRYPDPRSLLELNSLDPQEYNNPAVLLVKIVRDNLKPGGHLFFETDMGNSKQCKSLRHPKFIPAAFKYAQRVIQGAGLVDTGMRFETNDRKWNDARRNSRIYVKPQILNHSTTPSISPYTPSISS